MSRFKNPKELMAYVGLVPSEHSCGNTILRDHITKTGNSHVRRALIEAVWAYKTWTRKTKTILKRYKERSLEITTFN